MLFHFLIFEHSLIIAKVIFAFVVPDKPGWVVEANARAEQSRQRLNLALPIDLSEEGLAPPKEEISVVEMVGRIHLPDDMEDGDMMPTDGVFSSMHSQGGRSTYL